MYFKPGDYKYIDVNGDGVWDYNDAIYIGSALPEVYGGLVSEFRWKNIDVSLSFAYQIGRHMINTQPFEGLNEVSDVFLLDIANADFWEKPGDDADYPSWETGFGRYNSSADRYVEKVNWLKFKTLSIGYTLPETWMRKAGMKEVRICASGENLFSWHNYSGLDPETVNIASGIDNGRNYPLARKITLGLTLKF